MSSLVKTKRSPTQK